MGTFLEYTKNVLKYSRLFSVDWKGNEIIFSGYSRNIVTY